MKMLLKIVATMLLTAFMLIGMSAHAGEPRALKIGMYTPTMHVDDLFKTLVGYDQLTQPYKDKSDYYKSLFIKNDINKGIGLRVHRTAIEPGGTVHAFKLYIHYTNRFGQCGVSIMDVRRGGNYNYWAGTC